MCNARKKTWGFRFSLGDAAALAVFAAAVAVLHRFGSGLSWLVAIVAGLFCNVLRMARKRELIWAAAFLANAGLWLTLGRLEWLNFLVYQLPVSTGVIVWELKGSRYHGIFADRLNNRLVDYLEGRIQ